MARGTVKLPTASGVGAAQTATLSVPLGPTYHQLMFYITTGAGVPVPVASWATYVDEIRLSLNGQVKMRASAAFFASLAQYYGQTLTAGYLPVFFSRPWMRQAVEEDYLAWGTKDVQSFGVEVDFSAAATTPTMEVTAVQGPGTMLAQHITLRRYAVPIGVTGEVEYSTIPKGGYGTLAFHLAQSTINKFEIVANGIKVRDNSKTLAEVYGAQTGRVAQAGYTHIDFAETDRLTDALNMNVQDFRLKLDATATGNPYLYQEAVEGRPAGANR